MTRKRTNTVEATEQVENKNAAESTESTEEGTEGTDGTEGAESDPESTEGTEGAKPVVVAVKIDAETWDKAVLKGFRESRARTNSKILEIAIKEYVANEE